MPNLPRRQFLRTTVSVAGGGMLVPYWMTCAATSADETVSKNDRPHIGAIGIGGRGAAVVTQAARFGEVVAVCDVDRTHAERARERFGGKAAIYDDYRKLLEQTDVDVIINATPDCSSSSRKILCQRTPGEFRRVMIAWATFSNA